PTRDRLEPGDVETGALEVPGQQLGVADLLTRFGGAVVDTRVADQPLEELDGFAGECAIGHGPNLLTCAYTVRMVEWIDEVVVGTVVAALVAVGIVRVATPQQSPKPIPVRVRTRRGRRG